jgi:hypothetical protein
MGHPVFTRIYQSLSVYKRKDFAIMSDEEKELFFTIMEEAYQKGISNRDISVEGLFNEIKQKLIPVLTKDIEIQKEA